MRIPHWLLIANMTLHLLACAHPVDKPSSLSASQKRWILAAATAGSGALAFPAMADKNEDKNQQTALGFVVGASVGFALSQFFFDDEPRGIELQADNKKIEKLLKFKQSSQAQYEQLKNNSKPGFSTIRSQKLEGVIIPAPNDKAYENIQAWGFDYQFEDLLNKSRDLEDTARP